jgi:hypothetical protein
VRPHDKVAAIDNPDPSARRCDQTATQGSIHKSDHGRLEARDGHPVGCGLMRRSGDPPADRDNGSYVARGNGRGSRCGSHGNPSQGAKCQISHVCCGSVMSAKTAMMLGGGKRQPRTSKKVGAQAGDQSAYQDGGTDGGPLGRQSGDWRRGNASGLGYPSSERNIRPKAYNQGKPLRNAAHASGVGFLGLAHRSSQSVAG